MSEVVHLKDERIQLDQDICYIYIFLLAEVFLPF